MIQGLDLLAGAKYSKEVIQYLRLMLCIFLFTGVCIAEPIPCVDTLSVAQWGNQLRHIPKDIMVGGFAEKEFGDLFPVVKKDLAEGRIKWRINLLWSDQHNFSQKDLKFVKKLAAKYQPLCKQYPGKVLLSTFTEHNLSNPDKYHDEVQKVAPDCRIVNQPWRGAMSKKYLNEPHGSTSKVPNKPFAFSYDGENSVDSDVKAVEAKFKEAEYFCHWHPRMNLRYGPKDTASRPQRIKEKKDRSPDKSMLESLVYLFSNKGSFNIPKKWLVKSHAEKHDASDTKGDKLLIISPVKSSAIDLKRNGKLIARLSYYGVFDGGGYRYYWNRFGYTAGAELDVFIGKKSYGKINGGFRGPTFR